jgi:quinol monooxygenase YgiN
MIAVVWEFNVKDGQREAFESFCGADGPWTALARTSRSYLGSSFLRDKAETGRYLLIEYWSEMLVYEKHREDFRDHIARLEGQRTVLADTVEPVGIFQALNVPDRAGATWSRRGAVGDDEN